MLDWHWNEVADNFIELMQTDAADSCTVEDIIVCQHRLQEIIMRENRQANQSDTEPDQVERHEDSDEEEEFKEGAAALTTVHEQSDFTESATIQDRFATRCSLCNSQKTVGQRDPAYCDVHGEHDHAGAQNFTELADSTTLIYQQRGRQGQFYSDVSFCEEQSDAEENDLMLSNEVDADSEEDASNCRQCSKFGSGQSARLAQEAAAALLGQNMGSAY